MKTQSIKGAAVPAKAASAPAPEALSNPVLTEVDENSIAALLVKNGFVDGPEAEGNLEVAAPEAEVEPTEADPGEETEPEEVEETPAEETKTENEDEKEKSEDEDDSNEGIAPEIQEKINKRIGKEVAKTKAAKEAAESEKQLRETAEARTAELESELEQARNSGPGPAPSAENPLQNVSTLRDLQTKAQEAENILDFTETNLARLKRNPQQVEAQLKAANVKLRNDAGEDDYSPEAMEEWLLNVKRNADKTLRVHVPKRQQFIAEQQQADTLALEEFPFWKNPKSPEYAQAQTMLKEFPEIKSRPNAKFILGVVITGLQTLTQRQAERAAAAKEAPKSKTVPRLPGQRKAAPPAPNVAQAKVSQAKSRFTETGAEKDLTSAISAMLD